MLIKLTEYIEVQGKIAKRPVLVETSMVKMIYPKGDGDNHSCVRFYDERAIDVVEDLERILDLQTHRRHA